MFWKKKHEKSGGGSGAAPAGPPETKAGTGAKPSKKRKKKKRSFFDFILLGALLCGAGLVAYPTVSDWWNTANAYKTIADYTERVDVMDQAEKDAFFEAAEAYNNKLPNGTDFALTDEEMAEYLSLLAVTESGIMGYVEIPSINIDLPVYHTVEEDVLQTAVGHIPGTSLPVGGERTHSVLSGHRGLPSAKLFTDLDKLSNGDIFLITILDRTFTYQIDQIRIVLPEETSDLGIQPGRDYCTLVTCTPYGVNSHRMLVRGTRIDNLAEAVRVDPDAKKVSGKVIIPFIAAPMLVIALLLVFITGSLDARRLTKTKMLDELRNYGMEEEREKRRNYKNNIKEETEDDGTET